MYDTMAIFHLTHCSPTPGLLNTIHYWSLSVTVTLSLRQWSQAEPPPPPPPNPLSPPPPPPPQSCCLTKRSTQHCLGLKVKAVNWNSNHIVSLKDKTTGLDKNRILREELSKILQKKIHFGSGLKRFFTLTLLQFLLMQ